MKSPSETGARVLRMQSGERVKRHPDSLAVEEPLEIRVETHPVSVTMRTPGHDDELTAGFLLTEGLLQSRADLLRLAASRRNRAGNVMDVFLAPGVTVDFERLTRHVFAASSCGLCGKATIDAVRRQFKPSRSRVKVSLPTLLSLPEKMRSHQETFASTGGLHAAAIFDAEGGLIVLREDVGRHNAVDKVLGFGLLNDLLPFDRHVLFVSGRTSFEIMQKAMAAGVAVVASVSAPSSLAVDFARANGQTLAGFVRGDSLNCYANERRITAA